MPSLIHESPCLRHRLQIVQNVNDPLSSTGITRISRECGSRRSDNSGVRPGRGSCLLLINRRYHAMDTHRHHPDDDRDQYAAYTSPTLTSSPHPIVSVPQNHFASSSFASPFTFFFLSFLLSRSFFVSSSFSSSSSSSFSVFTKSGLYQTGGWVRRDGPPASNAIVKWKAATKVFAGV